MGGQRCACLTTPVFFVITDSEPPAVTKKVKYGPFNMSVKKRTQDVFGFRKAYLLAGAYCTFFVIQMGVQS